MKKIHKAGVTLMQIGIAIWFIETVTFLFIEGWHYKAVSLTEIAFDALSNLMINIGALLWLISAVYTIEKIREEQI